MNLLQSGKKSGREVIILENGVDVLAEFQDCVMMELEDDFNLSVASNFDRQPFEATGGGTAQAANTILSTLGVIMKNETLARSTLKTSMMSATVWSGSNPLALRFTCTFHIGVKGVFDPKRQVYEPIMKLSKLPLPWLRPGSDVLTAPGLVEGDVVLQAVSEFVGGIGFKKPNMQIASTLYSISVGDFFHLPWIVIENAEPLFNKQMAKASDGKMYPISGTISLGLRTVKAGTRDMLEQSFSGSV